MTKQTFTTGQVLTAAQMTSLQQTAMGGGSTTAKTASYVLVAADAGTVVQMNAAGATTITVNTALFAAGDSVQIQNIGAGVCTVTAGTATVSTAGSLALSQYEGGQLYFNTTSAALFFDIVQSSGMTNPFTTTGDTIYSSSGTTPARLGIGTAGQILTVASGLPSWATPAAAASGLVFISSASFTTQSSVSLPTNTFTSTYTDYLIKFTLTACSAGNDFGFRGRIAGVDTTTGYSYAQQQATTASSPSATGGTAADRMYMFGGTTGDNVAGNINVFSPQTTTPMRLHFGGLSSGLSVLHSMGLSPTANQYDSLTFFPSTGTCTGFYKVYGYANS